MKKIAKTFGLLILGYTVGEFVTGYRLQEEPVKLVPYTKLYFSAQRAGFPQAYEAGENLWMDREKAKEQFSTIIFPNKKR